MKTLHLIPRESFSPISGGQRGIALMLVIFAVAFIGIIVMGLVEISRFSWNESTRERGRFQAKLLAESGAAIASHPKVGRGDPVLSREFPDGRRLDVRITTEGRSILVSTLSEDLFIDTARELFILWGLDATEASIAADSLADWVDSDSEARSSGAETDYYAALKYADFPPNTAFSDLDQMLLVRGMDRVAKAQPLWRDYFTLYGDGTIDVNAAPADLIEAFFRTTPAAAASLVSARTGNDLIEGTQDDYLIEDVEEAKAMLGLSGEQWIRVEASVSLENSARRIESVGSIGDDFVYRLTVLSEGADENSAGSPVARMAR